MTSDTDARTAQSTRREADAFLVSLAGYVDNVIEGQPGDDAILTRLKGYIDSEIDIFSQIHPPSIDHELSRLICNTLIKWLGLDGSGMDYLSRKVQLKDLRDMADTVNGSWRRMIKPARRIVVEEKQR